MNKTHRSIWNSALGAWVAVSEISRARGKRSRGGVSGTSASGGNGLSAPRRSALALAILVLTGVFVSLASPAVMAACTPASPVEGDSVTCTGQATILQNNTFSSAADGLTVNVIFIAQVNASEGGTAMSLRGKNITLINAGTIDPSTLGQLDQLSNGTVVGSGASGTVNVTNLSTGIMKGTAGYLGGDLATLKGLALHINNGAAGTTTITNDGVIGSSTLRGLSLLSADAPVIAVQGGSQVKMTNTGMVIGRMAFQASAGGNTFVNSGSIDGGLSMGAASTNTFTAVTGSSISSAGGIGRSLGGLEGVNLTFAPTGQIDGGAGGNNALILQNVLGVGGGPIGAGTASSASYVNFNQLTVNSGSWILQGPLVSGSSTLNGGVVLFNHDATFGSGVLTANGGTIQASNAALTLSNLVSLGKGGLTVQGSNRLTLGGVMSGTGALTKSGSGQLTLTRANTYSGGSTLSGGSVQVGNDLALGSGPVTVWGPSALSAPGSVSLANAFALNAALSTSGSGALTLSGGLAGAGGLSVGGSGGLTLTGDNAAYSGATSLSAGSLFVGRNTALGSGALFATGNSTLDANTSVSLNNRVTLSATLNIGGSADLTLDGEVNGSGSLVKNGSAKLVLNGANGYTGATTVNAGTLSVNGSLASANVDVGADATLTGRGSLGGAVSIADGGHLGLSSGNTLSAGSLVLGANAKLDVALGAPLAGGGNPLLAVGGNLSLGGRVHITDAGALGVGVYRLMTYGGELTNNGLDIGSTPTGSSFSVQTAVKHQVNLVNTAGQALNFWDGDAAGNAHNGAIDGGAGTWTADATNWTTQDGKANAAMAATPGFAIFQGRAGTVAVDASAGALAVTGMQFASDGYTLKGDAVTLSGTEAIVTVGDGSLAPISATLESALGGVARLNKKGDGTLVLAGANSYSGGTTVSAGTLQIGNGGTSGSITGDVANHAALAFKRSDETRFDGAISGTGSLSQNGTGTLILTGSNSYTGGTTVSGGVLQGDSTSLQGNITNNARLRFAQNAAGSYAGAMGGSGALEKTGAGTLTLAGANSYSGGTTISAGTLVGSASSFGSGAIVNQGTLELAQATDGTLANDLSGNGVLAKTGAGALRYTGDGSAFSGTTQIHAGTLSSNGNLGGTLSVGSGARLQGSGTVGSTHLLAGAVLAPGNSIGSLKVAGDLTFDAGAHYEVEAQADGQSDQVQVSGKATLGSASAVVLAANGSWSPLTRYTILTAGGGLVGTFGTVSSNFAFLTPSLDYSAQDVALTLKRNAVDFAGVAGSANQRAAGAAVQRLGDGSLYNALVQLDAPTARSAFEQLSGEIHASLRTALVEDGRLVREAATDRLRLAQGGVAVNAAQVAQAADGGAGWARAYGAWGHSDSDANAAQMGRSVRGVMVGGDQRAGDWRLGAFAGSARSKVEVDARNSSATVNSVHLGLYGGGQWGALGLRTGLAYSRHTIETTRHVGFTGLAESALARYAAQTTQVFGELGWQLGAGVTALEPFASLAYVNLKTNGFQERGGISALSAGSQRRGSGMATLGLRASTQWSLGSTPVTTRGVLGWRHALGDVAASTSVAFAGGSPFAVAGLPLAKNVAVLELGLDMALQRDLTLGLAYSGQLGSDFREHGVKANLLWKF